MELDPADFAGFFCSIHGYEPFPWQQALIDGLADRDEWPDVLDLPTGAGKTAVLDAALFHLALRAKEPHRAALRVALVVDRRLVVDDAFGRAKKIADFLHDPLKAREEGRAVVEEVASRLRLLAGKDAPPLVARRLRGGAPLEHDWARTPIQPTILCSTVDQVGSRLLFRGYGVSNRMKPVHAGLLGQNCLILLDEAHLSEPFKQTLTAVQNIGGADIRVVLLSATPGAPAKRPRGLAQRDRAHPILKQRIETTKPTRLDVVTEDDPAKAFAKNARAMTQRLLQADVPAPAVGIVVNRVDLARGIFEELERDLERDVMLMIGRARSIDRDRVVDKLKPFRTDSACRRQATPLFVVATQCLEVGVDLDLDGLVTQAASFDALRQRFGRLNRGGRQVPAEGAILAIAGDLAKAADDRVYGDRIKTTWATLEAIADDNEMDFGVVALEAKLQEIGADVMELSAPRARAPVLMPAYLDLWSQTSPIPTADPDVGLFLHGAERTSFNVSIVWRSDIDRFALKNKGGADHLKALMELVPPRAAEMVEVPLWSARVWLRGGPSSAGRADRIADVPEREEEPDPSEDRGQERLAFRWAGSDDPRTKPVRPSDLRPGDVLVVPADYGGCDDFGWAPSSDTSVADVADAAAAPFRGRRHTVRIAPDAAAWDRLSAILAAEGDAASHDLIDQLLDELPVDTEPESAREDTSARPPRRVREPLEALRRAKGRVTLHFPYTGNPEDGAVLVAAQGLKDEDIVDVAAPATEDDSLSHTSATRVSLDCHGRDVAEQTKRFAGVLGLPKAVMEDLSLAALLHDAGKADRRFQIMLSGGDPWNCPDGPAIAKSGQPSPRNAWQRAGLPKGWRHEALSVQMARAHARFKGAHDPALVLWLIGAHHGYGRPFFNFVDDDPHQDLSPCLGVETWRLAPEPGPHTPAFDFAGADWPNLFEKLKKRYGIWGLARLEAILRLADHRVSETEHVA